MSVPALDVCPIFEPGALWEEAPGPSTETQPK